MAQRVTGFSRRTAAAEALHAEAVMRMADDESAQPGAIALELAPLIAPYRKHGRLSLRVERLPHRARLSRGHNNGDRSWSLMSDELDGLAYLPPQGTLETCTLGIRIVSLDGGDGATLALLDYPLSPAGDAAPFVAETPALPRRAPENDTADLRRLRGELARTKTSLAERDAEFALAQQRWEGELHAQLAASSALAAETLERQRAAWQAEQAARAAKAEPRPDATQTRKEIEAALARAEREWKAAEAARLAAAEAKWRAQIAANSALAAETLERQRAAWQAERSTKTEARPDGAQARREIEAALTRAETEWKAGEAARLAAAEAKWQARSQKALADAGAQLEKVKTRAAAESARERGDEAERRRLRDEVARLKKSLSASEAELAEAHERSRRESEAVLSERGSRQEQEARHLAAAKVQWQERSERALAEATSQFERVQARAQSEAARHRNLEAAFERVQDALAAANEAIADRENDIAEIQARLDDQAARTDAMRAHETESRRLAGELAALKAALAERERDIVKARADMEQARRDWQTQSEQALSRALAEWKKGEAKRIQAAESQGQEQSEGALTRMAQRLKQAEADLQQARAQAEALRHRGDEADIKRLRQEFGHLQSVLSEREMELAQLRLDSEHARERWTAEARVTLQNAEHVWKAEAEETDRRKRRAQSTRRTIRDVTLAASLSALAVLLFLRVDTSSGSGWPDMGSLTSWIDPSLSRAAQQPLPSAPAHMVTVLRTANVRSAPSKSAQVIATLPRDADVASLEHHGNWVRVKIGGAKEADGWVYSTFLKDKSGGTGAPQGHL